jgi:hypothetical protein
MHMLDFLAMYCTVLCIVLCFLNCLPDENRVRRCVFTGPKHGTNLAGVVFPYLSKSLTGLPGHETMRPEYSSFHVRIVTDAQPDAYCAGAHCLGWLRRHRTWYACVDLDAALECPVGIYHAV